LHPDVSPCDRLAAVIRQDASRLQAVDVVLVADAQTHGVHGLLRHALGEGVPSISPEARSVLDTDAHRLELMDQYFRRQTVRAVSALQQAGIAALAFKGEAIACTHYSPSHLRPRCDTDLLIATRDAAAAGKVLEALGYARVNAVTREAVHSRQVFEEQQGAQRHVIDLHWHVSSRPFFASMFAFDELAQDAVDIGDLAPGLRVPKPVYALVLACLHRVMHHENSMKLIWLYDISLLADRLSDDEWADLRRIAVDKAVCAVCATGIQLAIASFGHSTRTADQLFSLRALAHHRQEPSRTYLARRRGLLGRILLDARHAGSLPRTLQLLGAHAFPDSEYMRRKYGARNSLSLAGSYVYRAAYGIRRLVN
jgi:hypothetical protein